MDNHTIINKKTQKRIIKTRLHYIDNEKKLHYKSLTCQAHNKGGLVSHSHERLYTSRVNVDGRRN